MEDADTETRILHVMRSTPLLVCGSLGVFFAGAGVLVGCGGGSSEPSNTQANENTESNSAPTLASDAGPPSETSQAVTSDSNGVPAGSGGEPPSAASEASAPSSEPSTPGPSGEGGAGGPEPLPPAGGGGTAPLPPNPYAPVSMREVNAGCPGTSNHTPGTRIKGRYAKTADSRWWIAFVDTEFGLNCSFTTAADGILRCLPGTLGSPLRYFADEACTDAVYTPAPRPWSVEGSSEVIVDAEQVACGETPKLRVFELGEPLGAQLPLYVADEAGCSSAPAFTASATYFRAGPELEPEMFVEGQSDTSGSGRIHGRRVTGADGLEQLTAWIDSEFELPCSMELDAAGTWRCLPGGQYVDRYFYRDSACTEQTYVHRSACSEPTPFAKDFPACDELGYTMFAVGEQYMGNGYNITDVQTALCEAVPPPVDTAFERTLWQVDPISPDTFPAIEYSIDLEYPGRLKPISYIGVDGGCWMGGTWDVELEVDCIFEMTADGARCLPNVTPYPPAAYFADAECTEAVDVWSVSPCAGSTLPLSRYIKSGDVVYERIIDGGDTPYYSGQPGACSPVSGLEPGNHGPARRMAVTEFVLGEIVLE
jgi:hypothetical protein